MFGLSLAFVPFDIIKRTTGFFTIWVMFWNINRIYFFFLAYKILKGIVTLIFSNFFQSSSSDGNFIHSHLNFFIKGLISFILCGSFLISSWFNATVTAYWKHLLSYSLMGFIAPFLFFIQPGGFLFHPLRFRFILWLL